MNRVIIVGNLSIMGKRWEWGKKTYIMGILNVTPDSFSDGGKFFDLGNAVSRAEGMISEGADIIDVGGESTRPGSTAVSEVEEIKRIIPVIEILVKKFDVPISVDTYKAETAKKAIEAGAAMINDIWGLKYDQEMANIAAYYDVPICLMHNRTTGTQYRNLIEDMMDELNESIEIARKAGIKNEKILIDPGIGFAKTWEQNLLVLRHLDEFKKLGYPILLGASRKSFIGKVLGMETDDRLEGTLAVTAAGIISGVDMVRVHDVLQNKRVAKMIDSFAR